MSRINEPLNTKLQWSLNTLEMQKTNCEKDANRCWRWNSHFSVWNGKQNQKCTQQPINWNRRWERANRMLTEAREIPKINPQWFWMHSKRDKWKKKHSKKWKTKFRKSAPHKWNSSHRNRFNCSRNKSLFKMLHILMCILCPKWNKHCCNRNCCYAN